MEPINLADVNYFDFKIYKTEVDERGVLKSATEKAVVHYKDGTVKTYYPGCTEYQQLRREEQKKHWPPYPSEPWEKIYLPDLPADTSP